MWYGQRFNRRLCLPLQDKLLALKFSLKLGYILVFTKLRGMTFRKVYCSANFFYIFPKSTCHFFLRTT
jgi:hypothetical protein